MCRLRHLAENEGLIRLVAILKMSYYFSQASMTVLSRASIGAFALSLMLLVAPGCGGGNLSTFDVGNTVTNADSVPRFEIADQGSGTSSAVVGPGGHTLTRTTIGGSYLRRTNVQAGTKGSQLNAGLFGNPRATQ